MEIYSIQGAQQNPAQNNSHAIQHFQSNNVESLYHPQISHSLVAKTTSNENQSFDPESSRGLISCAHMVTALTPDKEYVQLLTLSDSGSGLAWVTLDTAQQLKLPQVSTWTGEISTLSGTSFVLWRVPGVCHPSC